MKHSSGRARGSKGRPDAPGRRVQGPGTTSVPRSFRCRATRPGESAHVLEGTPGLWLDGALHRLRPGDSVGFPAGTGIAHTSINDTEAEVRLLVVGEASKPANRVACPLNPGRRGMREDWWDDAPRRGLGPRDGMGARERARRARGGRDDAS